MLEEEAKVEVISLTQSEVRDIVGEVDVKPLMKKRVVSSKF